jgi:hypothetical protein
MIKIELPAPNPKDVNSIVSAVSADMATLIRNANCLTPSTVSMQTAVFAIEQGTEAATGRKTYVLKTDVMMLAQDGICNNAINAIDCAKNNIKRDCLSYPQTLSALGNQNVNTSCFLIAAAGFITGEESPCAPTSSNSATNSASSSSSSGLCPLAAAVDTGSSATTVAPGEDDKAPIGLIVGVIIGVIALLAIAFFIYKRVGYNSGARRVSTFSGNDPGRFNRAFNPAEQISGDDILIPDAEQYMDVRTNRCNTQFLANELTAQATTTQHHEHDAIADSMNNNKNTAKKTKGKKANTKKKAEINLSDDEIAGGEDPLMSPTEGAMTTRNNAAPAAAAALPTTGNSGFSLPSLDSQTNTNNNNTNTTDDVYEEFDQKPRRKRGITMTFI